MKFDKVYTEKYLNDLIEATYEIAPAVYYKYTWKPQWGITLDDYKQEAAVEVVKLFKNRFITPPKDNYTNTNLKTYIFSILNKYFTINLINVKSRETYDKVLHFESLVIDNESVESVMDRLMGNDYQAETPETFYEILEGKQTLESIIDQLSLTPYATYKYKYVSEDGLSLNETNLAKLITTGHTPNDIIRIFAKDAKYRSAQASYLRKKYKEVFDKLSTKISALDVSSKKMISKYLTTL